MPQPSGVRKWLYRTIAVTVVPLLFLALLEGGLRLAGFGHSSSFWIPSADGQAYLSNPCFGWTFFPQHLARAPVPTKLPREKADRTCRIVVLGGSAAMGTPDPAFGLPRFLLAILELEYPGVRFEVVNAAMTAVNSHTVVNIARDCLRHQPDALVVYMGNNEFVGPYGPGTVFGAFARSRLLIKCSIAARGSRIGQLVETAIGLLRVREEGPRHWQGMEMFLGKTVPPDDPRAEAVYHHFRHNLDQLCRAAAKAGVPLLLCTVATNLKDCPPLASAHSAGLSESDRARLQQLHQRSELLAAERHYRAAIQELREALEIDSTYAETHYRLAQCYLADAQGEKALEHFRLARDCDALRFRADSRINHIIRQTAAEHKHYRVVLVDAEAEFAAASETDCGVPGDQWFYEHVHFKPEGNYRLARTVAEKLGLCVPEWVQQARSAEPPASLEVCMQRLALTPWDRYRMAAEMEEMVARPPLSNQLHHPGRLAERRRQLARLEAQGLSAAALAQADQWYRQAIQRHGEDAHLRVNYAALLHRMGSYGEAERQLRIALDQFPQVVAWLSALADSLSKQGQWQEALSVLARTIELEPWNAATIHCSMAAVLAEQGQWKQAEQQFRKALAVDPTYGPAVNGLGACLLHQGQVEEAVHQFRKAIELDPLMAKAHANLSSALLLQGKLDEAEEHLRRAVQIAPREGSFWRSLAALLVRRGQGNQAIGELRAGLALAPADADLYCQLGSLLEAQGRTAEALAQYDAALQFSPHHRRTGHNRAALLAALGRTAEAIEQYRAVLQHHPNSAITLNNLAWLLATARNPLHRNGAQAVQLAQRAMQQPDHNPIQVLVTLAAAYAEAGDFEQAAATAARALQLAQKAQQRAAAAAIGRQLDNYRQRQPWREPVQP